MVKESQDGNQHASAKQKGTSHTGHPRRHRMDTWHKRTAARGCWQGNQVRWGRRCWVRWTGTTQGQNRHPRPPSMAPPPAPPLSSLRTPAPLDCHLPTICLLTCTLLFCPAVLLAAASIRLHLQWWLPRHVCAPCRQCCLGGNKSLGCACRSWVWQAPAGTKRSPVGGMAPLMPVMWKARRANTARDVRAVEASAEHTLKGR